MPENPYAKVGMEEDNPYASVGVEEPAPAPMPSAPAVKPPQATTAVEQPDYDMEGYIAKYGKPDQSKGQHLTDEFKRPNHMTFSSESKYSTPEQKGGEWKQEGGKWHFYASPFNLKQHSVQEMQDYFKRVEPNSVLHLPKEPSAPPLIPGENPALDAQGQPKGPLESAGLSAWRSLGTAFGKGTAGIGRAITEFTVKHPDWANPLMPPGGRKEIQKQAEDYFDTYQQGFKQYMNTLGLGGEGEASANKAIGLTKEGQESLGGKLGGTAGILPWYLIPGVGPAMSSGQTYQEAREAGATPERAGAAAAIEGATNAVVQGMLPGKMVPGSLNPLLREAIAKDAARITVSAGVGTAGGNLSRMVYDPAARPKDWQDALDKTFDGFLRNLFVMGVLHEANRFAHYRVGGRGTPEAEPVPKGEESADVPTMRAQSPEVRQFVENTIRNAPDAEAAEVVRQRLRSMFAQKKEGDFFRGRFDEFFPKITPENWDAWSPQVPQPKEVPNAPGQAQEQGGGVEQHPGTDGNGPPPEAGGGNSTEDGGQVAQEEKAQVVATPREDLEVDQKMQFRETKGLAPKDDGDILGWKKKGRKRIKVVDGMHRVKDSEDPTIPVKMIEAKDANAAKATGAMNNAAKGLVSPEDVARLYKETGITPEEVAAAGIELPDPKLEAKDEVPAPEGRIYQEMAPEDRATLLKQVKEIQEADRAKGTDWSEGLDLEAKPKPPEAKPKPRMVRGPKPKPAEGEAKARDTFHKEVNRIFPGEENKALRNHIYKQGLPPDSPEAAIRKAAEGFKGTPPALPPAPTEPAGAPHPGGVIQTSEDKAVEAFNMSAPNRGTIAIDPAVLLPEGTHLGEVFDRLRQGLASPGRKLAKGAGHLAQLRAILRYAQAADAQGRIQKPFNRKTGAPPAVAEPMITGTAALPLKGKDGKNLDMPDIDVETPGTGINQLIYGGLSPHNIMRDMFKPGQGPSADEELAATRYVNLFQGGSDYMRFVFKRNGIADDSARIGEKMLPHIDKIYGLMEQLAPLEKDRNGLLELMENVESEPAKATVAARLEEFDKQFQAMMSNAYQDLDEAWKAAKADLAEIAQWSPEARANMWMEGPKQRPSWLKDIIKPNEIKAAEDIQRYLKIVRDAAKKVHIPMQDTDHWITHFVLGTKRSPYLSDQTGGRQQVARDILAFHHRQPNGVNLMPSLHYAMSYYVPSISQKLAYQPFLNKWYPGGRNPYLTPNEADPYHAPNFGKYLQRIMTDMQYPRPIDVWQRTLMGAKQAAMTVDIAGNGRTVVKHVVTKSIAMIGMHHLYMAPAATEYMLQLARLPENLPFIGRAFELSTGKILDWAHMTKEETKVVQQYMANLTLTRGVQNTMMENPLISEYNQRWLNFHADPGGRKILRTVGRGFIKTRNLFMSPLTMAEGGMRGVNIMASAQRSEAANLSLEESVAATLTSVMDYDFVAGHDVSPFLKSPIGRLTAFTQNITKMGENMYRILKAGFKGQQDQFGSNATLTMVRVLGAMGTLAWLDAEYGPKGGLKLWRMMIHLIPLVDLRSLPDAAQWAYHSVAADLVNKKKDPRSFRKHNDAAFMAKAKMYGAYESDVTLLSQFPKELKMLLTSPKALFKSIPAVKQGRALLPKKMGGAVPEGYADALHYMFDAETQEAEDRRALMGAAAGVRQMRGILKAGEK